jgi:4a-hydroxytetrahydrobiopterin dehydratase
MTTTTLTPDQLDAALADLPGVHPAGEGRLQLRVLAPSFPQAIALVETVGRTAEELDHHPDIDVRWCTVTFGLSTHSAGGVTELDIRLAGRILQHAADLGAEPQAPAGRVEIAIDAADPDAIRDFWRVGLGYLEQPSAGGDVELRHPDGTGPVVWFQRMDPPRTQRSRTHLDVYLPADQATERISATVAAGGRLVGEEHAPSWWVLADAEGNELCICT